MDQSEIKRMEEAVAKQMKVVENITKNIDLEKWARLYAEAQEARERGLQARERLDEFMDAAFAPERRREERDIEVLKTLKKIENNTSFLGEIADLAKRDSEKKDEILELGKEIMKITTASNKEEAESIYRKTLSKINDFSGGVESVQKLSQIANEVFNFFGKML